MNHNQNRYCCIDLTKLVMSVIVVGVHTLTAHGFGIGWLDALWECVRNIPVPFFYLAAGFLLSGRFDHSQPDANIGAILSKYLVKIIKLYLIWNVVYFPLAVLNFWRTGNSFFRCVAVYLRGFFVIGEQYNSWMLWYLLSMIYAVLFVCILLKFRCSLKKITVFGFLAFLLGVVITEFVGYDGQLNGMLSGLRKVLALGMMNGRIFTAFLYFPVGMLLAKRKFGALQGAVLAVCGFMIRFFMDGIIGALALAVCAIGIFILVCDFRLKDSPIYSMMRKVSTVVYFIHLYIWTFYYALVYGEKTFGLDCFLITTAVSLLIGFLYVSVVNKRKGTPKKCFQ